VSVDLFGQERKRRPPYRGSRALVHVPADACPACGGRTVDEVTEAPALFFHGGYGATLRTVRRCCTICLWGRLVEETEARPRR